MSIYTAHFIYILLNYPSLFISQLTIRCIAYIQPPPRKKRHQRSANLAYLEAQKLLHRETAFAAVAGGREGVLLAGPLGGGAEPIE